ncbi:MAG TPA: hypothetical protein VGC49_11515 [Solirubrobacterales bacterium]|jgi:hypothetical protein
MVKRFWAIAMLALAAFPVVADADGGIGTLSAPAGVTMSGSPYRYVAIQPRLSGAPTLVERIDVDGGKVGRWWYLRGGFHVPAVAYDGSGGGLSADGRTLVLTALPRRYPPQRSRFAILDTAVHLRHPLRPGERRPRHAVSRFSLPGFYSFDAIAPDGGMVYLIHYLPSRGPIAYEVRGYEVAGGRLLSNPIVDPEEAGERMQGLPITRAMSPDGRWAYTLYDGNGKAPFLHALDTVRGLAVCVDLPQLAGRKDLFGSGLRVDRSGRELTVLGSGPFSGPGRDRDAEPLLTIDAGSFAVHGPRPAAAGPGSGTNPWVPIGIAAAALAAALFWVVARRGRMAGGRPVGQG